MSATIPNMLLAVGETFAAYTIVRLLGSGGMGEVYLAQHPRLPRRDALKVMDRSVSAEPGFRERFLREADLASALWHPHIVGVHDRGEYRGQLWISVDFVDGEDCGRLIERRYPAGMPQEMAIAVVEAVASALDYAHNQGLLHRDVKPANIMLANIDDHEQRRVLLTDFGIARECNDISGLTTTNMAVGTVAYCAPEQLMGADVDSRADGQDPIVLAEKLDSWQPGWSTAAPTDRGGFPVCGIGTAIPSLNTNSVECLHQCHRPDGSIALLQRRRNTGLRELAGLQARQRQTQRRPDHRVDGLQRGAQWP